MTTVLAIGLVRPEATGRGLGTFITLLAEEHARRQIPAGSGRFTVRQTRFAQNDAAAVLFRDLGYERVRTWWRMAIELGHDGACDVAAGGPGDRSIRSRARLASRL